MSRGGFGGGRGGFSAGFQNIETRFNLEEVVDPATAAKNDERDSKPSDTFPPFQLPVTEPPTYLERRAIHHYRTLRARIHDGPLYCILDPAAREYKSYEGRRARERTPPQAHFDAFGGQETYTKRFVKKHNALPNLKTRPFVKEYFPQELWKTMGVEGTANGEGEEGRDRKKLKLSTARFDKWMKDIKDGGDDEANEVEEEPEEDKADDEQQPERDVDDDDPEQEDVDPDQLSDDEDDDYNAEAYFENGADDDVGDDGAGNDDDF